MKRVINEDAARGKCSSDTSTGLDNELTAARQTFITGIQRRF